MQLKSIRTLKGRIYLRTGLHIGAGKETVEIGGLDQPIVKDPLSGAPYIPGSSLKGKMRSLLEVGVVMGTRPETREFIVDKKTPCGCGKKDCPICVLFGAHNDPGKCEQDLGPTRLLVRDAMLCTEDMERFKRGELPMEIKYENTINRVTGTADNPRPLERVPAGVSFEMNIALKVFDVDKADDLVAWLFKGLKLVELDALGGGSSRGNGQVVFEDLTLDGQPVDLESVKAL